MVESVVDSKVWGCKIFPNEEANSFKNWTYFKPPRDTIKQLRKSRNLYILFLTHSPILFHKKSKTIFLFFLQLRIILPKHLATPGSNSKRLKKRNGARTSLKRSQLWLYRPKNQQSQTQFLHYVSKTFFPLLSDLHSVLISLLHCGKICRFFLLSEKKMQKKKQLIPFKAKDVF